MPEPINDILVESTELLDAVIDGEMVGMCFLCNVPLSEDKCLLPSQRPKYRDCFPHSGDECDQGCPLGTLCKKYQASL